MKKYITPEAEILSFDCETMMLTLSEIIPRGDGEQPNVAQSNQFTGEDWDDEENE